MFSFRVTTGATSKGLLLYIETPTAKTDTNSTETVTSFGTWLVYFLK